VRSLKRRTEDRLTGVRNLPLAETIYLFRCGETGLYAFTADPNGQTLPSGIYPQIKWRLARRVTQHPTTNSPGRKIARAILDAIAKHGFHLSHAAVDSALHSALR
jgi:hypothetical protein